jgi:AcrR family transcriptional regulator
MSERTPERARRGAGGRPRVPGLTESILNATIELAAEEGLEDLTLDAIAARANVGRPTIYRRWPSKEALLAAAVEKMVDDYFVEPHTGNIRDDLVEFARLSIDRVQGPLRSVWTAFFHVEASHLAPEASRRARERNLIMVRSAIERGELRPDADALLLVELIFAVIWYRAEIGRPMNVACAETIVDGVLEPWLVDAAPAKRAGRRSSAARA